MSIPRSLRAPLAVVLTALLALMSLLVALPGASAADGPGVSVSPDTGLDASQDTTLTIRGSGFVGAGAALGAYVTFGASSLWQPGSVPPSGGWVALGWVQPRQITDGSFETTLTVPAGAIDPDGSFGVATFAAHGLSATDRTLDTWTPVAFAAGEPEPTPSAEPTKSAEPTPSTEPEPSVEPTSSAQPEPSSEPTATEVPSDEPTASAEPTRSPDPEPTTGPSDEATDEPSGGPSTSASPTSEPSSAPGAVLSVSPGVLPVGGGDLVVTGSGFSGSDIYVQAGWVKDSWRPSQGGLSGTDRSYAAAAVIGSVSYATARFDGAGGFVVTLPGITAEALEAKRLEGASLAVFTVATGSVPRAADETSAEFAFAPAPEPAVLSVSPGVLPVGGGDLVVTGSGFSGSDIYVQAGWVKDSWRPSQGGLSGTDRSYAAAAVIGSVSYATARFDGAGGFVVTLPGITAEALEAKRLEGASLAVFTVATGSVPRAADETSAEFAFAPAPEPEPTASPTASPTPEPTPTATPEPTATPTPEPTTPSGPAVSVTPATGIDPAVTTTLTVVGSGFTGAGAANGLYLAVGTSGTWRPGQVPGSEGWALTSWLPPQDLVRGAFTTQVEIPAGALIAGQAYGLATFAAHGLAATNRTMDTWTPLALRSDLAPVTVTTTNQILSATSLTAGQALTVTSSVAPATARGTLALLVDGAPVASSTTGQLGHRVTGLAEGTHQVRTTFTSADPSRWANSASASAPVSVSAKPVSPTSPTGPATGGTAAAGELLWGVKSSFRSYVTGPIAQGTISVSGGAGALADGRFRFPQASAGTSTSAGYRGTVTFSGHHGELALGIAAPSVRIVSGSRADLVATVGGARITLATLDLAAGTRTTVDGAQRWSGVPTRLTTAGAGAFDGFYTAGELMDPVTFTIGSQASASANAPAAVVAGATGTAAETESSEIPADPPSSTGLTVTWSGDELVAGSSVTASGSGFEPGETGIRVVLYSDPVVLASNVTANDQGTASWSGRLPANLTGQHTLTLQGSTSVGRTITIVERPVAVECEVTGATLEWGIKESFRSYISGSIAHGGWTTSGAVTYTTPQFTWTGGSGDLDSTAGTGLVQFDGDVRFTGHDAALDTTLGDPALELSGDRVYLVADISGETRDGKKVASDAIRFAEVDASVATLNDGIWALSGASATLTAAGAAAFGTYSAGDPVDPVTATVPVQDGCATATSTEKADLPAVAAADAEQPQAAAAAPATQEAEAADAGWLPIAALLAAVGAAVGVGVAVQRGRKA